MKATRMLAVALALALAAPAGFAQAQAPEKPQAKTPAPKYDVATETTLKGTVEEVKEFDCPVSGTKGFHLTLKTPERSFVVHVASVKLIREFEFKFAAGEEVEVTGSKVKMDGEDTILARQIVRGNDTMVFRDPKGKPVW